MKNISKTYLELSELLQEFANSKNQTDRESKIFKFVSLINKINNAFFKEVNNHNLKVLEAFLEDVKHFNGDYDYKNNNQLKKRNILEYNNEFNRVLKAVHKVMLKEDIQLAMKIKRAMDRGLKKFEPIILN
jgi:hypothetical protein